LKNTDTQNSFTSKNTAPKPGTAGAPKMISPAPGGGKTTKVAGKGPTNTGGAW
jgi:hypothetical protein